MKDRHLTPVRAGRRKTRRRSSGTLAGVLLGMVTAAGCAESPPEEVQKADQQLAEEVNPIDAPGTPAVMLEWTSARDGKQSTERLEFQVRNTTDQPVDVQLLVTSRAGSRNAGLPTTTLQLAPRSTATQGIAVADLGVQVVGKSAVTHVVATYQGPDGMTRTAQLPGVWVEHEQSFRAARVRSADLEASANARRGFAALTARRPGSARVLDAARRASVLDVADDALRGGELVRQLPELPTPAKLRAAAISANRVAPGDVDVPDSEKPTFPASVQATGTFDKAGNFSVCISLPYLFQDSLLGDDFLNNQGAPSTGLVAFEPARYMAAVLMDSAGTVGFAGNLDSGGCTGNILHGVDGQYTAFVTTSIFRSGSNTGIDVTPDDTNGFIWAWAPYQISGSGGTVQVNMWAFTGAQALADTAISAANTVFRATPAYPTNTQTAILTDQTCPTIPGSGCQSGNSIFLGSNHNGLQYGLFKVVTAHELGHRVQRAAFGLLSAGSPQYVNDATQPSCRCDHVTSSNALHCLQSRHLAGAAQVEGWGQFFAATSLNDGSQSNCTLAYYKEFLNDNGSTTAPPMAKSCFNQVRWRANHCSASSRGVEWDWMNFFWRLKNKDSYSFANFTSVYQQACGGSCQGANPSWSLMVSSASTVFGSGSTKANAWSTQGTNFGSSN